MPAKRCAPAYFTDVFVLQNAFSAGVCLPIAVDGQVFWTRQNISLLILS